MMDMIQFFIPGPPQGKQRARSGRGRYYTPKETVDAERAIAWEARKAMGSRKPFAGSLQITIKAWFVPPHSWSKVRRAAAKWKTSKPDADNISKLVLDSINKVVWDDDAQIAICSVFKQYSDLKPEGVEVFVAPL